MGIECVGKYKYNTNDKLGSGHFGHVYKGCKKEDETFIVAIKVLERSPQSEYELNALKKLKDNPHDNIVIFHDYYELPGTLVLVMECCNGGTLAAYKKEARIDDKTLCIFTQQLTNAIKHFHSLGIVHRDLKPDNILLKDSSATLTLKIADFGTARWIGIEGFPFPCPKDPRYSAHPAENCSSKVYQTVDRFSVGRIIRSLVEGQPPSNSPERAKLQKIIRGLENEDPAKRMPAEEVLRILSLQPKDDEQPYDDEQPNDDNSLLAAKSSEFAATSSIFTSVLVPILMKFYLESLVLLMIVIVLAFIFKMNGMEWKFPLRKKNEISVSAGTLTRA